MTELFVMRDKISRFVKEYETWFLIIAKFIGMMFVFNCVNSQLGYFEILDNPMVNVLLSLICSIIPGSFSVFIVAAVITAHMIGAHRSFGNCCDAYFISDVSEVCTGAECGSSGSACFDAV